MPVISEFKFLGLIFDKKLTFNQHIKYVNVLATLLSVVYRSTKLIMRSHSQGLGSGLCDFAQIVLFSCPFEIGLWLCCVRFGSAISPQVS